MKLSGTVPLLGALLLYVPSPALASEQQVQYFPQLADGGRLVIPVGDFLDQELLVISKAGEEIRTRAGTPCRFVPLRGRNGWV